MHARPLARERDNAAERAIRGLVLGRKNHYGSRSRRGTELARLSPRNQDQQTTCVHRPSAKGGARHGARISPMCEGGNATAAPRASLLF